MDFGSKAEDINIKASNTQLRDVLELRGQHCNTKKLCFLSWSTDDCNIMHVPINEVEIDGVPQQWPSATGPSNCIQLECQHCFHASALVLHFMTHNMTCPVCREGHETKLNSKSLPKNVRNAFESYYEQICHRTQQDENNLLVHVNMNFDSIMRDFTLLGHINELEHGNLPNTFTRDITIITSRIRLPTRSQTEECVQNLNTQQNYENAEAITHIQQDDSMIPVFIQHSFIRHLSLLHRRDASLHGQFHIHHPMLNFTFSTVLPINLEALVSEAHPTVFKAIYHDGLFVGFLSNRCYETTEAKPCLMLWLRVDLITQCVVAQIQDHLQAQIPNDFTVFSRNQNYFSRNTISS